MNEKKAPFVLMPFVFFAPPGEYASPLAKNLIIT
jgi:hypothetical protein